MISGIAAHLLGPLARVSTRVSAGQAWSKHPGQSQPWVLTGVVAAAPDTASDLTSEAVRAYPVSLSSVAAANTTPYTRPSVASSGPPELPGRTNARNA